MPITSTGYPLGAAVVDVDSDSYADVLACGSTAELVANFGSQGAQAWITGSIGVSSNLGRAVSTADFDQDGDLDVVWASSGNAAGGVPIGRIWWHQNLGGRSFGPAQTVALPDGTCDDLIATDVDGDGDLDMAFRVLNYSTTSSLQWIENLGLGLFSQPRTAATSGVLYSFSVSDLDSDGDQDFLATGAQNLVMWYENRGPLGFTARSIVQLNGILQPRSIAAGDFNGDGRADVAFSLGGPLDGIYWCAQEASGTFSSAIAVQVGFSGDAALRIGDINNDGHLDILAMRRSFSRVEWFQNSGMGTWSAAQAVSSLASPQLFELGDIDGDGDLDVVIGVAGSGAPDGLYWHANLVAYNGLGFKYCVNTIPNSTGQSGRIIAQGSLVVPLNSLQLVAERLPQDSTGFFLTSRITGASFPVSNSQGRLCLGGFIGRFSGPGQIKNSGASGSFDLTVNFANFPQPFGNVIALPGETWHFQAWHRDANPLSTSNFTDAVGVVLQ